MPNKNDYAALAAVVYNDQRGNGTNLNRLSLPQGWNEASTLGFTAQNNYNSNFFSFTAGAYVNGAGEIVIAYKGTDFLLEFAGRAWNTAADLITDVSLGVAGKLGLPQQLQAMSYYLDVKDWAVKNGYNPDKISFTGHSLGGGLASNMAVWFDKSATTFAQAPFEPSTLSPTNIAAAGGILAAKGALQGFTAVQADAAALSGLLTNYTARQSQVINYYIEGEALSKIRYDWNTVMGQDLLIQIGPQPISRGLPLHSMNLHAAFLYDDQLRKLAKDMPELVPALLDGKFYQADPNSRQEDLISKLVNDQHRVGFGTDSALTRFSNDLYKLGETTGSTANPSLREALIVSAMEYYYVKDARSATGLFQSGQQSALTFEFTSDMLASNANKAKPRLDAAIQAEIKKELGTTSLPRINYTDYKNYAVQSGTGVMETNGTANNDIIVGGTGSDRLRGGAG
ncbi:MAG: hypothetical protein ING66_14215, partial [Rhodocyclaceae bacterium]|nr:hypothetical protein [Rhodocyclaceae bacterium]